MLKSAALLLLLICSVYVANLTIEELFGRTWFYTLRHPEIDHSRTGGLFDDLIPKK
jgi:hypothetical protein